jgi:hypothetical protein
VSKTAHARWIAFLVVCLSGCRSSGPRPLEGPESWGPPSEHTEFYPILYRKAGIRVGGVAYRSFGTTGQVRASGGLGAVVDFEDLLGVDKSLEILRLDGFYQFNPRHRIDMSFYDIGRSGGSSLSDPIEVGEVVIPAGETGSLFDTTITKLAYRYSFVTDPRTRIAASFGLHVMKINLGIASQTINVNESLGVTAPLPVIGLHGSYALSEKWSLEAGGEVFQLMIGDYGGTISDFRLGVNWDVFEHVGLGVELNSFNMDIEVVDGPLEADLRYGYQGVGLYLRAYL